MFLQPDDRHVPLVLLFPPEGNRFQDEARVYLTGKVNSHNIIFLGTQNQHKVVEHVRDSPKVFFFSVL